jgi:uncharacterized protein
VPGPTFRIVDEVHITPVNYGVDQLLLFRTAEGPSRAVEMGTQLAFEVEEVTGGFARRRRREWDGASVAG